MIRKTIMIDDELAKEVSVLARKEHRDFSGGLRHALKIGIIALQNPELTANEIEDILEAKAEIEEGMVQKLDLEDICIKKVREAEKKA